MSTIVFHISTFDKMRFLLSNHIISFSDHILSFHSRWRIVEYGADTCVRHTETFPINATQMMIDKQKRTGVIPSAVSLFSFEQILEEVADVLEGVFDVKSDRRKEALDT